MILGWGLTLAAPGDTLAAFPAYDLLEARAPENTWALTLILIGIMRMVALIINGRLPRGSPVARGFAAFLGALVWSQFFAAFLDFSWRTGAPSGGLTVYFVLCVADVFSCGRAGWDAVRRWR